MTNPIPLITFEGDDGAGKSTVINRLKPWLNQYFTQPVIYLREPGGTEIAEQIRATILKPENIKMSDRTELLLYEAARSQLVDETIRPALDHGNVVVCDRFIDSTTAYQGQSNKDFSIDHIHRLNEFATHQLQPGLTIYLAIDANVAHQRIQQHRSDKVDRLDAKALAYHQQVVQNYEQLASQNKRIYTINAEQSIDQVVDELKAVITDIYPK